MIVCVDLSLTLSEHEARSQTWLMVGYLSFLRMWPILSPCSFLPKFLYLAFNQQPKAVTHQVEDNLLSTDT